MITLLVNALLLVVLVPATFWLWGWLLRRMDDQAGLNWPKMRAKIEENPNLYLACRLLATAVVLHALFGRYLF
jgi:hypothetical protein